MLVGVSVACNPSMAVSDSPVHAPSRRAEADIPVNFRTSRRESFMLILMVLPLLYTYTGEACCKDHLEDYPAARLLLHALSKAMSLHAGQRILLVMLLNR